MYAYLKDLSRSASLKVQRVFFKGGQKRQLQEQLDVHKLFLFTGFHAQHQQQQGGASQEQLAAQLIEQAKALPFQQQQLAVQDNLHNQLVNIGRCIHTCLEQQQDRKPAATRLEQAWQRKHQQEHPHSNSSSSSSSASPESGQLAADSQGAGKGRQVISQAQLSQLVQQQLGYSLAVRASQIQHQDAGLGLFVEGDVPPGALVALFPGLVYGKDVHRRMPGYPRMSAGNPYLTARYDGRIIDSLPWGRGWLADGLVQDTAVVPPRVGYIGRMAAASDGPKQPIPETTWVRATTGEAASLELLEGRNPLALAHYANHPAPGTAPNTIIASFSFKPAGYRQDSATARTTGASSDTSSSGGSVGPSSIASSSTTTTTSSGGAGGSKAGSNAAVQAEPWLRAYVPNISYRYQCSEQDLLTQEVYCIGLVAVAGLPAGTEVLFNYRLSPSLLGRPRWYVPVDDKEENMRWS